ncbi:hypothetical protein HYH02_015474 [Chlamydomonas schloesseri]|uniref:Uncharacterized protein n=1 Tax=Chlamydomonas schloesseri TaxID=2026947 RepID=A0A835VMB8_9CHLO|nr:hypothetical protein HYH02_015474 [Chlamydomonas schloesseri]|eukprot:KAG2422217.1 hypothetical protein HYH02_015474 [Chlamydomonas schloesseri]
MTLAERRVSILRVPELPQRPKGPSKRITVSQLITSDKYDADQCAGDAAAAAKAAAEAAEKAAKEAAKAAKAAATALTKSKSKPQLVSENVALSGKLGETQRTLAPCGAAGTAVGAATAPDVTACVCGGRTANRNAGSCSRRG